MLDFIIRLHIMVSSIPCNLTYELIFSYTDLNYYVPRIERMVYNATSHTLTCISTRSPATTVIWRRNGVVINTDENVYEREQMLIFSSLFEYHNQLIIIDSTLSIAGVTCQISNTLGLSQIYPIIGKILRNQ